MAYSLLSNDDLEGQTETFKLFPNHETEESDRMKMMGGNVLERLGNVGRAIANPITSIFMGKDPPAATLEQLHELATNGPFRRFFSRAYFPEEEEKNDPQDSYNDDYKY